MNLSEIKKKKAHGDITMAAKALGISVGNARVALKRPESKRHIQLVEALTSIIKVREYMVSGKLVSEVKSETQESSLAEKIKEITKKQSDEVSKIIVDIKKTPMQRLIQLSEDELLALIKKAVREVLFEAEPIEQKRNRPAANKKEAAEYLGISQSTINRLLAAGALPSFHIGRTIHLKWADLDQYVNDKSSLKRVSSEEIENNRSNAYNRLLK